MPDQPTRRLDESPPPTPRQRACPECGGAMVWARTYAPGIGSRGLFAWTARVWLERGKGSFLHGPKRTECQARVWLDCGYTQFYAAQPERLRDE